MLPGSDGLTICREVRAFSDGADHHDHRARRGDRPPARPRARRRRLHVQAFQPARSGGARECGAAAGAARRPTPTRCRGSSWTTSASRHASTARLLDLTPVEFRLLRTLASHARRIFSRAQLLDNLYADHRIVSDRTVDSHVKNLRRKLEDVAPARISCNRCTASATGSGSDAPGGRGPRTVGPSAPQAGRCSVGNDTARTLPTRPAAGVHRPR